MTALYLVGDVFDRVAELRRRRVRAALVLCSPPFLALRSYLPDGHPLKASEIGSEATPAAFIDVMLALVAELAHVLEPWGSIAFELGDTYAGSGGAGGDYDDEGLRTGQNAFDGSARRRVNGGTGLNKTCAGNGGGAGWPLDKSLAGIPQAFMLSLAYGYNVLDRRGPDSPAGRWRVRNFKPWLRSNPPVGALGDKERPATSYITVATRDRVRYFDLDAVRTRPSQDPASYTGNGYTKGRPQGIAGNEAMPGHPMGAPPRDWVHTVDMVLDACLDDMAGKRNGNPRAAAGTARANTQPNGQRGGNWDTLDVADTPSTVGARGVHLRRALERAGILATVDAIDRSPKGYRGAHYAVWPPELVKQLVLEMTPQRVCTTCGQPSRRITVDRSAFDRQPELAAHIRERREALGVTSAEVNGWFGYKEIAKNWERTDRHGAAIPNAADWPVLAERLGLDRERFDDLVLGERRWAESTTEYVGHRSNGPKAVAAEAAAQGSNQRAVRAVAVRSDLGWSDCGHGTWTPGRVLDPFVGSGTTLQVCSGLGRDSIGIDLDYTNVVLAMERVGMWLDVEWPEPDLSLPALGAGSPHRSIYTRWARLTGEVWHVWGSDDEREARSWRLAGGDVAPLPAPKPPKRRQVPAVAGQAGLF